MVQTRGEFYGGLRCPAGARQGAALCKDRRMRGSGLQGGGRLNGAAPERRGGSAMAVDVGGIASSVRQELRSGLRGQVICQDDLGYDAARAVFNGIIDRRPLAVIRPVDASDVVRCIEFARRHDLPHLSTWGWPQRRRARCA